MTDAPWEATQRRVEYEGIAALYHQHNIFTEEPDELEAEKRDGTRQAGAEVVDERRRGEADRDVWVPVSRSGSRYRGDDAAPGDAR